MCVGVWEENIREILKDLTYIGGGEDVFKEDILKIKEHSEKLEYKKFKKNRMELWKNREKN